MGSKNVKASKAPVAVPLGTLSQPKTLYHGTTSQEFFDQLCNMEEFGSQLQFTNAYCNKKLSQNAQHGPGIYLTDSDTELEAYGGLIVQFDFEAGAPYLDLTGVGLAKKYGCPVQELKSRTDIHALLKSF